MKTITTETFSINIPEQFQKITVAWESVRAENIALQGAYPMLTVALGERAYYEKFEGDDLATSFYNSCLERRGKLEVLEDTVLLIDGKESYVRLAKGQGKYFHFLATIPVNDKYCYDFAGDCEIGLRETYLPVFEQVWQSLRYFGDPEDAMEKQKAGIAQQFNKLGEQHDTEEQEEAVADKIPDIKPFTPPENEKEVWRTGDIDLELLPATEFVIGKLDGKLYIDLKGRAVGYDEKKHSHILNDYQDGKVYLRFALQGVYDSGIPIGTFQLEKDNDPTYQCSLWKDGFHYSLELYGRLTLKDGWAGFSGYFQSITGGKTYPVKIAIKIPVETLDWSDYRFVSLDEALPAPASLVRYLYLTNPDLESLPDTFYDLRELRTLHIAYYGEEAAQVKQLREIPARLAVFRQLTDLSLTGMGQVTSIPVEIDGLKNLENLTITGSKATSISHKVMQLPKLKYCNLAHNQLQAIGGILSGSIENLNLEGNQLTDLPDYLVKTASLRYLNIKNNPLEHLPANIRDIERLELELEKKQQLLDYTYKGADDKGAVDWDEAVFYAKNDPKLLEQLDQAIAGAGFSEYEKGLKQLALQAVALETTDPDTYNEKGNTRFGGLPDLPPEVGYPTFKTYHGDIKGLQFIAQLNLGELAPYQDYLPRTGMLYFFIEDQESLKCQVLYYEGGMEQLHSAKELDIDEEFIYDDFGIYDPYQARAEKYPSLPYFYSDDHLYMGDAENLEAFEEKIDYDQKEKFLQLLEPAGEKRVHSINSHVFTQHESPQIQAADKLGGKAGDWIVFLSVESENKTGFQFWDAGTIYFVIHKSDLFKRDFSNIYYGLESS